MYTFHILTIGHLSRNRYWGESDSIAYRRALATCTLISGSGQQILVDPSLPEGDMHYAGFHHALSLRSSCLPAGLPQRQMDHAGKRAALS